MAENTTSSSEPPVKQRWNGSTFLGSDTYLNIVKNFYRMATNQMAPVGQEQYWRDADIRYRDHDCKMCEKWRDNLLQTSPLIVFMRKNISQLGGDVGPHNIRCRTCLTEPESGTVKMEGGFDHQYGIRICANRVETKSKMEDVMAHEMVHAYDHLRFKTNLDDTNLRHAACTEVRRSWKWTYFPLGN